MNESEDRIEKLKKKLYSPSSPEIINKKVRPLEEKESTTVRVWQKDEETIAREELEKKENEFILEIPDKPKASWGPWIFALIAFIFFAGSSVFAWYYIVNRAGVERSVEVLVTGPVSAQGGKEVSIDVSIENKNNFPLDLVDLVVKYPPGTKDATDVSKDMEDYREGLGTIAPGEKVTRTVRAILFGSEREKKTIIARAEYSIPNSNAAYDNEKVVDIFLETAPVEFVLEVLKEATINQEVELALRIRSNTPSALSNMLVKAEYPAGFSFSKSVPAPTTGNNIWNIAEIGPESTSTIIISGTFSGEADAERYFRFEGGVADKLDPKKIAGIFASSLEKIRLVKPFIGATLKIDDEDPNSITGDIVTTSGKNLSATINWVNNLNVPITDLIIEAKLNGVALDRKSVNAFSGFYRSSENKITWNKNTNSEFERIDPGVDGTVNFSFATLENIESIIKNQQISLDISVKAKRPGESNVPEEIKSTIVKNVKIQSDLALTSRAVYYVGPFVNSGPLPPRPEQHTTYTVVWTLINTSNDLTGAVVAGFLPPYVSWAGQVAPANERITYDDKTGKITWNVGTVPSGTGYTRPAREVAFQVDLFPSVNQVGETPLLVQNQTIMAEDSFTKSRLEEQLNENVSTRISTDPNYSTNIDRVAEGF